METSEITIFIIILTLTIMIMKVLTEIKESVGRIETKVDDLNSNLYSLEVSKQLQATQIKSDEGDQQPPPPNVGKNKKKNRQNMGQSELLPPGVTIVGLWTGLLES